ncbi:helix-turn-helix transcriptional regulator [Streptomyces griseocarneus]|uniref:helix-turn-helix transcriptional regulator n=1 Tax=Streptomyces griseocarneus TaxID=51201 RepID=UPI00167E27A2|nr:LuxR family transcriptional regulator [Streptomyces griseocarneus]MBZ6475265.1 AAA family ATPase [Streptomyces griseocarneus]GHG61357.1 transcriptional regulator [Streptomyces griseocarneus]
MTVDRITGRGDELEALGRFLTDVRSRSGRALVLRGEPGAGKSTLLRYAAAHAAPARVLTATGAEPESGMAFAALHQLLRPVVGLADALPDAQRDAVRAALGLAEPAAAQDRFLVSAGVLSLLTEAAVADGLLCVVDDFQWVDQASADALLFAARRFAGDGVGLLIGTRDVAAARQTLRAVPSLGLGGLDADGAREVLASRAGTTPAPAVVELVTAATGGNPLALHEAAGLLTAEQLTGRAPLPDPLPVGDGVAGIYGEQIARLPEDTRLTLLVAALEGRGDPRLIRAAAARLEAAPDALDAAEAAGIVDLRPAEVRFRHPLIRAAVHAGASPAARRAAHRHLAALLEEAGDRDRAARHRAEAATGPDEDVAAGLAAAGERARARGGYADAARILARAAELTPDPGTRARRLKDTAAAAWLGGHPGRAQSALAAARDLAREPVLLAELAQIGGRFELSSGNAAEALQAFLTAAERAAAHGTETHGTQAHGRRHEQSDDGTRRVVLALLADAAEAASYIGDTEAAVRIGRRAAELTTQPGPPRSPGSPGSPEGPFDAFLCDVLTGMGALYEGETSRGVQLLRRALAALPDDGGGSESDSGDGENAAARLLWAAAAASLLGESDAAARYGARAGRVARVSGTVGTLPVVLENAATAERMNSGFALSAALSEEGLALAREAGLDNSVAAHLANLAVCAAVRGREDDCRAFAHEALAIAIPHRLGLRAGVASYALGLLDLGLGRFDRAHERLTALTSAGPGAGHPVVVWGSTADRVEAAVAAGDLAAARAATDFLGRWSADAASPRSRALLARCGALVADDGDAPALLRQALDLLGEDGDQDATAYDRARTELLLGERLRRDRRAGEARPHLRQAAEAFHRMGAVPWERRARGELRAAGETAGPARPAALETLTAQELRIARLVAEGVSNRDVAARLFLSPRTVEYHLYKVYPKLGITSRAELARLLR